MTDRPTHVDLWYPGTGGDSTDTVTVGLVHVRAADNMTIRYDFDRDGYSILMQPVREEPGHCVPVGPLQEVAFVPSWLEAPDGTPCSECADEGARPYCEICGTAATPEGSADR